MKKGGQKRRDIQASVGGGLCTNESQSEKTCKEFIVAPSESHMGLGFPANGVMFYLVMDWVLHVLPDEVKPNCRGRAVSKKYVLILRTIESIELYKQAYSSLY